MSHSMKHCHSSGSQKASSRVGTHHHKISSHVASHRGGSHISYHGGSNVSHHGGSHVSHHEGSHKSHHGGSHKSHHGGSQISHQGGTHMSHQGGSYMSLHLGSHMSHHGGSHMTHGGSNHKSHHGSHHMSHNGGSHMTHGGSHHMSHHGGHHMSHHGGHHMSHHGGHHMSHHGGPHTSQHGGHHLSHHGGHHMSHHGGHHTSHHGGHHMSRHGGLHTSHHGGHHMSRHGSCHGTHHGSSQKSHHGGHHKKEVSFSKYVTHGHKDHSSSSGHHSGFTAHGMFDVNEKEIMQLLNERLSSYLSKVRSLEMENAQLENKICEWYENNPLKTPTDGTQYFKIIDELQNQIMKGAMENANAMLQIDNAGLAAADYRSKYDLEFMQCNNTEMDGNNLTRVFEGLNAENCELEMHVQSLQEERNSLKRNSEEEIESLLSQLGARINVELNAAPSIDLNQALSEIREEYENLMERNLREVEDMFFQMSVDLSKEVASSSEELQSVETEIIEMKRCVQGLEIDLQSELSLISALGGTLAETEATFRSKLAELQCLIDNMESELGTIRSNLERQNYEYKVLMDQKTHLEMEIATYKRLLDGHNIDLSGHNMPHGEYGHHIGSYHYLKNHSGEHHSSGLHSSGHKSGGLHASSHHNCHF